MAVREFQTFSSDARTVLGGASGSSRAVVTSRADCAGGAFLQNMSTIDRPDENVRTHACGVLTVGRAGRGAREAVVVGRAFYLDGGRPGVVRA